MSYQRALPEEQELTGQTGLSGEANAKTDWATDSPEKKRSGFEGVEGEQETVREKR
ncbi:MAG: hypothetical protein ACLRS1_00005 [Oscillospiraceae bacterium]